MADVETSIEAIGKGVMKPMFFRFLLGWGMMKGHPKTIPGNGNPMSCIQ